MSNFTIFENPGFPRNKSFRFRTLQEKIIQLLWRGEKVQKTRIFKINTTLSLRITDLSGVPIRQSLPKFSEIFTNSDLLLLRRKTEKFWERKNPLVKTPFFVMGKIRDRKNNSNHWIENFYCKLRFWQKMVFLRTLHGTIETIWTGPFNCNSIASFFGRIKLSQLNLNEKIVWGFEKHWQMINEA